MFELLLACGKTLFLIMRIHQNRKPMKERILVTGASGFIGSHLVDEALERGMQVWAGVRGRSSRRYLSDSRLNFAELDLTDSDSLEAQLALHKRKHGGWDYIIHCAGVTKCLDKADFEIGNFWATRNLIETLQRLDMVPKCFVMLSSLSVFGPVREDDRTPIEPSDTPCPDTAYGLSKLHTEEYLCSLPEFPYVILRPTGVYGPRERDYLLMAQAVKRHVDFGAGFRRQDLTFVYVKDLVQAVFLALEKGVVRREWFVTDGKVYDSRAFAELIRKELGNPWMIHLTCPLVILRAISWVCELVSKFTRKPVTLNGDKYKIMRQRNWKCNIRPLEEELGYQPQYPLERGVKETMDWYKKEGWL